MKLPKYLEVWWGITHRYFWSISYPSFPIWSFPWPRQVIGLLHPLILQSPSESERQLSYCVFADIMENTHGSAEAHKMINIFVPVFLELIGNGAPINLRSVAFYALGTCAEHGGDSFLPFLEKVHNSKNIADPSSLSNISEEKSKMWRTVPRLLPLPTTQFRPSVNICNTVGHAWEINSILSPLSG